MMNLSKNNSKILRTASYDEFLLPLHTLWMKNMLSEAQVNNILETLHDIELVTLAENEITVKSRDNKMTHSYKV